MALLAAYGFNEGQGSSTADDSGNGHNISGGGFDANGHTLSGGTAGWSGQIGADQTLTNFTVMAWVRQDDNGAWTAILQDEGNFFFEIQPDGTPQAYLGTGGYPVASEPLEPGVWTHLAIAVDNTTGSATLYVDGVADATGDAATDTNFGGWDWFIATAEADLDGAVDDLRTFSTTLSQSEIQSWMNTPIGGASAAPEGTFSGSHVWTGSFSGSSPGIETSEGAFSGTVSWMGTFIGPSRFVASVDPTGRYFLDQAGDPILIKGDSNWSLVVDSTPAQMENFCDMRASQGFNATLVSLLGNTANGGPNNNGSTHDGILPFIDDDPSDLNPDYWDRVDDFITYAASKGLSVLAYPIDGWTGVASYNGLAAEWSNADAYAYGQALAERMVHHPNVWLCTGGDYSQFASTSDDERLYNVMEGLRDGGVDAPRSVQFFQQTTSLDSDFWADEVDWSFVYVYAVTYVVVERAYGETQTAGNHIPALMSETHYEDAGGVTDLYIRSQAAWALTSGSPGEFYGSESIWDVAPTDENMQTTAVEQLGVIRATVEALDWWTLVPDFDGDFITGGRGTKGGTSEYFSGNTYVTGGKSDDGSLALLYVPDASETVTLDMDALVSTARGRWVDPTNGDEFDAGAGPTFQRTTDNDAGGSDYLLILEPSDIVEGTFSGSATWTGAFAGEITTSGAFTGATGWAGSFSGEMAPSGTFAGSHAWAGSFAGTAEQTSGFAGEVTWTGAFSGQTIPEGTFAGTLAFAGSFTGSDGTGPEPRNLTVFAVALLDSEWSTTGTAPTWTATPTEDTWSANPPTTPWSTTGASPS